MTKQDLIKQIEQWKPRSAWDKGVKELMFMIVEHECRDFIDDFKTIDTHKIDELISLAKEWSYNGELWIYDQQLAEQFCTPSELKRVKGGKFPPNSKEQWVDLQARACYQAFVRLRDLLEVDEQVA